MRKNKYVLSKLTALTSAIYLVGAIASGALTYWLVFGVMLQSNQEKLESVLYSRASAVEEFYRLKLLQIEFLAKGEMVSDALQDFSVGFERLGQDLGLNLEQEGSEYLELLEYYDKEFLPSFPDGGADARRVDSFLPHSGEGLLAQWLFIAKNQNPAGRKNEMVASPFGSSFERAHAKHHPRLNEYMKAFGYRDLFLLNLAGDIVYSSMKEVDLGTNVIAGVSNQSGLGSACQAALLASIPEVIVVDFKNYAPSFMEPASFLVAPVLRGGEKVGVVALQLDPNKLNSVVSDLHGLGGSGEAYVIGADLMMRTDSRFSEDSSILRQRVDSPASRELFRGLSGSLVCEDYRGIKVLSQYAPLAIPGLNWGILAEVDLADLMAPAKRLAALTALVLGLTMIVITLVSMATLRLCVVRPLKQLLTIASKFKEGHYSARVYMVAEDEFAALAESYNQMAEAIQVHIENLEASLAEIKELRGLLPICSCCKSIRDDDGYFKTVETYLVGRSNVEFSHTICQDCVPRLYPELSASDGLEAE